MIPTIVASRTRQIEVDPAAARHSHFKRPGTLHHVRFVDRWGGPWGAGEMFLDDIVRLQRNGHYRVEWE